METYCRLSSTKFIQELVLITAAITDISKVLNPSDYVQHRLSVAEIVGGPNRVGLLQTDTHVVQFKAKNYRTYNGAAQR